MCLLLTRKLSNSYKGDCCVFVYLWYCFIKSVNIWSCVCNWCNTLQFPAKQSSNDTINPLQLFIFTTVIRCSRLQLCVGYFVYLKFTHVSSIVYQLLHLLQLNKQIDQSIKKCVFFYLMFLNIYYWEKLTIWKPVRKVNFLQRKFEQIH